eukprot:236514_1
MPYAFHIAFMISIITITKSQNFAFYPLELPYKIHSHASGIYNNTLTIINGIDDATEPIDTSYSVQLSPTSTTWTDHDLTMPLDTTAILIEGDSTVQIDHLLYIVNPNTIGNDAIRYKIMFVYDLSSHQYVHHSAPLIRSAFPCTVYNANRNTIYIIGGIDITAAFPVPAVPYTQTYSVSANRWDLAQDMNIARGYAGCAMGASHEYIFLFGGARSVDDLRNGYPLRSIERYSVIDDEWNVLPQSMKTAKGNIKCSLLPMNEKIYCSSQAMQDTKWEVFDPMDFAIQTIEIETPRILFSVSLWRDTCLMVTGGAAIRDGVMSYFDSTEYLGQCPPPNTLNPVIKLNEIPTFDPTITPTLRPTKEPTNRYDVSQCFIGKKCYKSKNCCPNHFHGKDRESVGISCHYKHKLCCLEVGYVCSTDGDCCGRNKCEAHVCVKPKFPKFYGSVYGRSDGTHGGDVQLRMHSQHMMMDDVGLETMDAALVHNVWVLAAFCAVCLVLLVVAWCGVVKTDYGEFQPSQSL